MTRRELLATAGAALCRPSGIAGADEWSWEGDLAVRMMDGAHRLVDRKIAEMPAARPSRARLLELTGAVDPRVRPEVVEWPEAAVEPGYRLTQVRWSVLEGVAAEGLWIRSRGVAVGRVIALGDAGQTPEQLCGLVPGLAPEDQFARRLAENGFDVLIPALVDRGNQWSGHPEVGMMPDQTHREWIYRQAFHLGRHVIGYEIQSVLAALDWFGEGAGVAGYGEGGLIALYAAAADPRIRAAVVSGYFDSRKETWREPIYRNLWSLVRELGDAGVASLIAPRGLIVEFSRGPEASGSDGVLRPQEFASVRAEFDRIGGSHARLMAGSGNAPIRPLNRETLREFARLLGAAAEMGLSDRLPRELRAAFSNSERQRRLVRGMEGHVQTLIRRADRVRREFFLHKVIPALADSTWTADFQKPHSPDPLIAAAPRYRTLFWEQVVGKIDDPVLPPNPRTRRILETERWTADQVVLDVWRDSFAWGILLLPKDLKPGERRPVVVCQHGRNGVPMDVIQGDVRFYRDFGRRLAERGYIVFAPHGIFRDEKRYRPLNRKANLVKASVFSFVAGQHEQILRWLGTLPMVDAARIAFYGLSFGGETALRVPPLLTGYCLSICAADFNSWTHKVAGTEEKPSFVYSDESEIPCFNMGNTFDHADLAALMIPRPFMVERGHDDRVGEDAWVAYEYAKVRRLYDYFGLGERTEIEYFDGGHTIHGEGTFRFLDKHLGWTPR